MSEKPKSFLFITSKVSRGLSTLASELQKTGKDATIASCAPAGIAARLRVPHIRLYRFKLFRKRILIPNRQLRDFLNAANPLVFALDHPAYKLAAKMKIKARTDAIHFGLDMRLFSPDSVSAARIVRFLSEYNIAPYQKMIVVISRMGDGLVPLLNAMKTVGDPDLVVALYGFAKKAAARKIMRQIKESGQEFRIIYIPADADLPTMLRAAYATLSLFGHNRDMMMSTIAMGRPAIWGKNTFALNANIEIKDESNPADVAAAISAALTLSNAELAGFEKKNISTARAFSVENTIKKVCS